MGELRFCILAGFAARLADGALGTAPVVSIHLPVVGVIVVKAFSEFPPVAVTRHNAPLYFFGAMIHAMAFRNSRPERNRADPNPLA